MSEEIRDEQDLATTWLEELEEHAGHKIGDIVTYVTTIDGPLLRGRITSIQRRCNGIVYFVTYWLEVDNPPHGRKTMSLVPGAFVES